MGLKINRATFLVFIPILIAAGVACIRSTPEPIDQPIVLTPVTLRTLTPAEWATTQAAVATAVPTPWPTATPTPTPWPAATATSLPLPTNTATPLPVPAAAPTAAPTPTSRPTSTPVPTKISRWAQIQRDYRDGRITYEQAVEQAIEAGMSESQARVGLAQIRIPPSRWSRPN